MLIRFISRFEVSQTSRRFLSIKCTSTFFLLINKAKSPSDKFKIRMTIVYQLIRSDCLDRKKIHLPYMRIEVLKQLLTSSLLSYGNWDTCILYYYTSLNI